MMKNTQTYPGVEARGKNIRITFQWRCKRQRETLTMRPTHANLKAASRIRESIIEEIRGGAFDYAAYFPNSTTVEKYGLVATTRKDETFHEMAQKWLQANSHLARGTMAKYRSALRRHWLPAFGKRAMVEIKFSELAAFIGSIPWTSAKARNNALIPLRQVFEMAFLDDLIDINPAAKLKNQKAQKPQPDPLELSEVEKILEYMQFMYPEQVKNYFEFAFFTGLRIEEQIALQWGDIDMSERKPCMQIRRARTKGEEKETKTHKIRYVDLNSRAISVLEKQKLFTGQKREEYVFHNPVTDNAWNDNGKAQRIRYWNPTLKRLEIRHRRAYDTRHTYATMMLMSGNNPAYAASQMGHSVQMFLDTYTRWIHTATQQGERAKLEQFIGHTDK